MKHQLMASLGDYEVPVNFRYQREDPFTLAMTIVTNPPATWLFARDLLRDGLYRPAGEGAVRVSSGGMTVGIGLDGRNLSGGRLKGVLVFLRDDIASLVHALHKELPFGGEGVDWDVESSWVSGVDLSLTVVEDGAA